MTARRKGQGWHRESRRHSLARRGIRTVPGNMRSRGEPKDIINHPYFQAFKKNIPHLLEPSYYADWKNERFKIVYMPVKEYENAIRLGFWKDQGIRRANNDELRKRLFRENIDYIKKDMLLGNKWTPPQLYYKVYCEHGDSDECYASFGQEGHHRAVASEELGERIIPVMIVYPTEKYLDNAREFMTPYVQEALGV